MYLTDSSALEAQKDTRMQSPAKVGAASTKARTAVVTQNETVTVSFQVTLVDPCFCRRESVTSRSACFFPFIKTGS